MARCSHWVSQRSATRRTSRPDIESSSMFAMLSIQKPYVVTVEQMARFEFPGNAKPGGYPSKTAVLKMKATMQALGYDGIRVVGSKSAGAGEW